ncbi:MAG TPA: GNAT family N-acetyltransferase [Longimicrobium sp.]|nr:GNAT family N-acetyltransferase [Longimicrobium sp.]
MPTLRTERLVLRPFAPADAARVRELAGERDVASTTLTIPHPYEEGMAESWIAGHAAAWDERNRLSLAVTHGVDGVIGAIGLNVAPQHAHAETGYWIGAPYWNRGFATEALGAILAHGFGELGLHRVLARHFPRNPASGQVLRKAGMVHEGIMREHVRRWDRFEDLECYAILERDWRSRPAVRSVDQ